MRTGEGGETQVYNKHTVLSFFCHTKRLYPTPALLLALILHLTQKTLNCSIEQETNIWERKLKSL